MISKRFSVFALLLLLIMLPMVSKAYSLSPLPELSPMTNGYIRDVLVEPTGHVIIAGSFQTVGGQPRLNLARLLPDGSVDPTWRFDTNGGVRSLARSATGQIYVAGPFTEIGGQVGVKGLVRLVGGPKGMQLDAWATLEPGSPEEVEVAAGGDVIVLDEGSIRRYAGGGTVADIGWGATSQLMPAWDIAVSADGEFVATCSDHDEIAKLTRQGGLVWRKTWSGVCAELEFAPDGALFAARRILTMGLPDQYVLSRITQAGEYDLVWEWPIPAEVDAIAFSASGEVYVGAFSPRTLLYGTDSAFDERGSIYRLAANGTLTGVDAAFANGAIETISVLASGDLLVAGPFSTVRHERREALARVSSDFAVLRPEMAGVMRSGGQLTSSLRLPDGTYLVAGRFSEILGQPRRLMARLSSEFELMPDQWALEQPPTRLAVDAMGHCYAAGLFPPMPVVSPSTLLRLEDCSTASPAWVPGVIDEVSAMAYGGTGDDAVYVSSCTGQTTTGNNCQIRRFSTLATGAVGADWSIAADGEVTSLLVKADALFAAGDFRTFGGLPRARIAKLQPRVSGSIDAGWIAARAPQPTKALLDPGDQEIIAAGSGRATGAPPGPQPALVRLNATTGAENAAWRPWSTLPYPHSVGSMALASDGYLYFGEGRLTCCFSRVRAFGAVPGHDGSLAVETSGHILQIYPSGNGGGILVAGKFTAIGGVPKRMLALLKDVSTTIFLGEFE